MIVYLVQHLHVHKNGNEDIKTIGIYSSVKNAKSAIKKISKKSGFSDFPSMIDPMKENEGSGFYIDRIAINVTSWQDGFDTV